MTGQIQTSITNAHSFEALLPIIGKAEAKLSFFGTRYINVPGYNCHWIADVIFKEDDNVMDRGNSAENMELFRRLAMNIAAVADPQRGLAAVRRAVTFGTGYLQGVPAIIFCEGVSKNFS